MKKVRVPFPWILCVAWGPAEDAQAWEWVSASPCKWAGLGCRKKGYDLAVAWRGVLSTPREVCISMSSHWDWSPPPSGPCGSSLQVRQVSSPKEQAGPALVQRGLCRPDFLPPVGPSLLPPLWPSSRPTRGGETLQGNLHFHHFHPSWRCQQIQCSHQSKELLEFFWDPYKLIVFPRSRLSFSLTWRGLSYGI